MTETESQQSERLSDSIRQCLADTTEQITNAVLVFETAAVRNGEPVTGRHRAYPLGPMSPSAEYGLLQKAADDARSQGCVFDY